MDQELGILAFQTRRMGSDAALDYIKESILPVVESSSPDIVVMPEKWVTEPFSQDSEMLGSIISSFAEMSEEHECVIVPGSFSVRRNQGLYNTSPAVSSGKVLGWQDKISLFRDEKKNYTPGQDCKIFSGSGIRFTISVCYDSDFPYYSRIAAMNGSDIMLNPALIHHDFREMWRLYIQARSLENRLPFVAVNSLSDPFLGGSMIVGIEKYMFGARLKTELAGDKRYFLARISTEGLRELRAERLSEDPGTYGIRKD